MIRILILLIVFLFGLNATAQVKQGYFHYEKVILEIPVYSLSQKKLEVLKQNLQDSLNILSTHYQNFMSSLLVDIQTDSSTYKKLNDSILRLENNIFNYRDYVSARLAKEEQNIQADLKSQLTKEIKIFARKNNIDCVSEKQAMMFCDNCVDLTNELIIFLRQQK